MANKLTQCPGNYDGYTVESPNHVTCGTPKPLAKDWESPAEVARTVNAIMDANGMQAASNAAMEAAKASEAWRATTNADMTANNIQSSPPVPDILSAMDDWDEKYKDIFGEYPEFSRLFVRPPIAEFGLKSKAIQDAAIADTRLTHESSYRYGNSVSFSTGIYFPTKVEVASTPKRKIYTPEEALADPFGIYQMIYDPHDFTPRMYKIGSQDAY
jgi:hypothetical protein